MAEIDIQEEMAKVVAQLTAAVTNIGLYTAGHPQVGQYVDKTYAVLAVLLQARPEVTVMLVGDDLVAEGKPLPVDSAYVANFIRILRRKSVERVSFVAGLQRSELQGFISDLAMPDAASIKATDCIKLGKVELRVKQSRAGAGEGAGAGAAHGWTGEDAPPEVIDELAIKLGMDPITFRLKNGVHEGSELINGALHGSIGAKEVLGAAQSSAHYRTPLSGAYRGRGVAHGYWGNWGARSCCTIRVNGDGTVSALDASLIRLPGGLLSQGQGGGRIHPVGQFGQADRQVPSPAPHHCLYPVSGGPAPPRTLMGGADLSRRFGERDRPADLCRGRDPSQGGIQKRGRGGDHHGGAGRGPRLHQPDQGAQAGGRRISRELLSSYPAWKHGS